LALERVLAFDEDSEPITSQNAFAAALQDVDAPVGGFKLICDFEEARLFDAKRQGSLRCKMCG
jgi:hypothetical protein